MRRYAWTCLLLLIPSSELGAQSTEDEIVAAAREACADLDGGEFAAADDAVLLVDLDGDGNDDMLIDEGRFACSTAASLFTPTGGAQLHAIVGGRHDTWMAQSWRLVEWGDHRILLLAEHGTQCGGFGYQACFEAIAWSDEGARTVRRDPPDGRE
jgi:hypothetical protein